jgi:hypothetical protein
VRQNRGPFSDFVAFCHAGPFLGQDLELYDKLRGGAGGERQLVLLATELFELDAGSWARVDLLLVEHGQIAADCPVIPITAYIDSLRSVRRTSAARSPITTQGSMVLPVIHRT